MNKIAIIGSGFTGLSLALHLPKNVQITFFDKSRKPGGRISTRTTRENPTYAFDHGLSFVYGQGQMTKLLKQIGAIKEFSLKWCTSWEQKQQGTIRNIYSGNPNVESIAMSLLDRVKADKQKITCEYNTRVASIIEDQKSKGGEMTIISQQKQEYGPYNYVYVCVPFPQCRMLQQNFIQLPTEFDGQEYFCNWTVMVAASSDSEISHRLKNIDVCERLGGNMGKIVKQNWKQLKTDDCLWVFHMDEKWSQENKNMEKESVEKALCNQLTSVLGINSLPPYVKAHRWLYAKPKNTPKQILVGRNMAMGADWVGGGSDIQHCWKVGKELSKLFKNKKSNL